MKKLFFVLMITVVLFSASTTIYAQEEEAERVLILREGKEHRKTTVSLIAYLIDDVLEITVEARKYADKPRINNVFIKGPKLGRLAYLTKKTLYKTTDEIDPFEVTEEDGLFRFDDRKKKKKPKGTATRELFKLKIPKEKIQENKRYFLWVYVEGMKDGGKDERFKFELKDLYELLSE